MDYKLTNSLDIEISTEVEFSADEFGNMTQAKFLNFISNPVKSMFTLKNILEIGILINS